MKQLIYLTTILMATGITQAAALNPNTTYNMNILADGVSCFNFAPGTCVGSLSNFINTNDPISTGGDGYAGIFNITTSSDGVGGVNFTVNSMVMDAAYYNPETLIPVDIYTKDPSLMSGHVDALGNINFNPAGRRMSVSWLGDISMLSDGAMLTSGISTSPYSSLVGAPLDDTGRATIVNASVASLEWGILSGMPLYEHLNVSFTTPVPLPASIWLFGPAVSGLFLMGRRKKRI